MLLNVAGCEARANERGGEHDATGDEGLENSVVVLVAVHDVFSLD